MAFGQGDEHGRADEAPDRVVPAQQGLHAGDGEPVDVELRLVDQGQLVVADGGGEVFQQGLLAVVGRRG